ncbi:MAG TPA: alpha/beta fold hydrolase [Planctomycetaceae bacterium]|nr:alpha/beta fold hydrolase [Planctomycetaceae bacterium]
MQPQIRTYIASDGYRLHYRHWEPAGATPRAIIVALHGIQSHSGWFTYSSGRLCQAGFEVFYLDRRGSGMNEPSRGHVEDYKMLLADVSQSLADIRRARNRADPPPPVILLGASWGGKLAAIVAARNPEVIDGLALLYPGLCSRVRARWDQNLRLKLAEWLRIRNKRVRVPLDDAAFFTDEPRWREFIRSDPLALHEVTVSFLLANRDFDRLLASCPAAIHCPVLLMLAANDQITDNEATRRYVAQFSSQDASVIEYPHARHALEFEPDRDKFIDDLIAWLDRLAPRQPD